MLPHRQRNDAAELPESINSLPCVNHPSVTGDGLELYFASTDTCQGRDADIFVSKRSTRDDAWGEPQLVESLAWTPGISSDGLRLYFVEGDRVGKDLPEGNRADGPNVFVRTRNSRDEDFGPAVELGDPPNTSGTTLAMWGPEESPDGETLYFTSGRSGTPHGWGAWQTTPAELCDINGDGSCDVDDLSRRALFSVNLTEGSERESDILKYDISGDGRVDQNDLRTWLSEAATTNGFESPYLRGDANLDGRFESDDLVSVFQAGKYELDTRASWSEGDWTGDRRFDSSDLVAAFQDGGYELGARAAVSAVPEPSCAVLVGIGIIGLCRLRKRR